MKTIPVTENHQRSPSALHFMARAFLPSPGLPRDGTFAPLVERWTGLQIRPQHLAAFRAATQSSTQDDISILYPHVLGFRLQMALLTHRAFPFPIWHALQIRNQLTRHRKLHTGDVLDLQTMAHQFRRVDKGVEVDLRSTLLRDSECIWESTVTYFYRGQSAPTPVDAASPSAPTLCDAPVLAQFQMPTHGGWQFGALTGDYNGIHWASWYARRFGFRSAFLHPQRVAGLCLAKLAAPQSEAQRLDLWIKGPLPYGADVTLRAGQRDGALQFGLSLADDSRMALVGSWRAAPH